VDRLFLDANALFSAAYRADAAVAKLWALPSATLVTSRYAVVEAERNLDRADQLERLTALLAGVTILADSMDTPLGERVVLPEKDVPILAAAVNGACTHLITGDVHHFGPYFGKTVAGVLVLLPAEYLELQRS